MYGALSWLRARPSRLRAADISLAAALCVFALAMCEVGPQRMRVPLTAWLVAVTVVTFTALPLRRRRPVLALALTTAGAAVYLLRVAYHPPVLLAPLIVLHHTAATTDRRTALRRGVPVVAVLVGSRVVARPEEWSSSRTLAVAALAMLALAAGDAVRSRRDYIAEVEERARRAEQDREAEARRRVTQERLRIARDLHDQVGHHLALISVQAGVADYVLERRPEQARESLAHIRQASRAALDELKDTIGLLREPGDAAAPTDPTVGLSGLGELVASFRTSGLLVEHEVDGAVRPLAPAADLTAYRVVQEALTNVRKHAGAVRTRLRLSYRPAELRIEVDNDAGAAAHPAPDGRGGHGIRGMRERVGIVGGTLSAGPRPSGGFRVSAVLPLSERAMSGSSRSGDAEDGVPAGGRLEGIS